MEKIKNKYILLFFFFIVWMFWAFYAPAMLNYQEETQLFLFDSEQFMERIAMPAGIARYVAEFLVQFYYNAIVGGAIIAAILCAMQLIMWQIVRRTCKMSDICFVLGFVPSILLWYYQGEIRVKLTFAIALLMTEIVMLGATLLQQKKWYYDTYLILATPILAWIAGPVVMTFGLFIAFTAFTKPKNRLMLAMAAYAPMCIFISSFFALAPLDRLFGGIGYTMDVDHINVWQIAIIIVFAITPYCLNLIPQITNVKTAINIKKSSLVLLLVMMALVSFKCINKDEYEVLEYDALVRAEKWDDIISKAEKKTPNTPLTVASLNLALAIKGQLMQRGFDFYQNDWTGAFPRCDMTSEISIMTAEIFFHLGLVNTAQRLDFDSMEALADNAKSVRVIKRLAETNLINGQYDVARKYLKLLRKTMCYASWAGCTMKLLDNEKAINDHPLYGHLRKLRLTEDFLFSDDQIDKIMGKLFMQNTENTLATQYLLFLPKLEGNEQKYMMYLNYVNKKTQKK